MRRPTAAATGMLIGGVLLVGARLATRTPTDLDTVTAGPPGEATDAYTQASPDNPGGSPQPPPAPGPRPTKQPASTPSSPADTSDPPASASAAPEDPGPPSGTFVGDPVTHQYGMLQLTVTIADGQITDVQADYETSSPVSTDINNDALPKLRQETLAAQSAEIDTVSGATYTSDAYRSSLQSALDQAEE
jgi:uncharacterized protein with FMN-binding domain